MSLRVGDGGRSRPRKGGPAATSAARIKHRVVVCEPGPSTSATEVPTTTTTTVVVVGACFRPPGPALSACSRRAEVAASYARGAPSHLCTPRSTQSSRCLVSFTSRCATAGTT